jgi:hypothetical protein
VKVGAPLYEVGKDQKLRETLDELFIRKSNLRHGKPGLVIETGTGTGLGTTSALIDGIRASKIASSKKFRFYSIEISEKNVREAENNLEKYNWLKIIHGSSVDVEKAIEFVKTDEMIRDHLGYPDIYIDSATPVDFYSKEADGQLFGEGERGENAALETLIFQFSKDKPLFVLDSCGGTGLYEFMRVVELMGTGLFYVLIFGTKHLKHFRSAEYIRKDPKYWNIIAEGENWMLAHRDSKTAYEYGGKTVYV